MRRNRPQPETDEKLVGFRMSPRRYSILKAIAGDQQRPIAELINDSLDQQYKLDSKALLLQRIEAVTAKRRPGGLWYWDESFLPISGRRPPAPALAPAEEPLETECVTIGST